MFPTTMVRAWIVLSVALVLFLTYRSLKLEIVQQTIFLYHDAAAASPTSPSSTLMMKGTGERPCWLSPQWGMLEKKTIPSNTTTTMTEQNSDNSSPRNKTICVGNRRRVVSNTSAAGLTCPMDDDVNDGGSIRRQYHHHPRTKDGITIALLYYAQPSMLIYQLNVFDTYPMDIQRQLTVLIVDDGSPLGLRASEYISRDDDVHRNYRIRLVRITKDKAWNIGGARNLAFHVVDTQQVLLLDIDMWIPIETIQRVVYEWKTFNATHTMAHRFNRKRMNGGVGKHPAVCLIDANSYWYAGGCDEDFVGNYGFTDVHFWYRWKADPHRIIVEHSDTFLIEYEHDNVCDPTLLLGMKNNADNNNKNVGDGAIGIVDRDSVEVLSQTCNATLATLKKPGKGGQHLNKAKIKKKRDTGCWSNEYLRFPWIIEWQ